MRKWDGDDWLCVAFGITMILMVSGIPLAIILGGDCS